jgi:hypothetical protein
MLLRECGPAHTQGICCVLSFFCYKNLFARRKYTHFSTGKYKNYSWSTNLPAEHSLCEEVTVLSRQGMEGTAVKKWHKKKHCCVLSGKDCNKGFYGCINCIV